MQLLRVESSGAVESVLLHISYPEFSDSGAGRLRQRGWRSSGLRYTLSCAPTKHLCGLLAMMNVGTGPAGPEGEGRATPAKRQWVVDVLCEAYAQDQLGLEELERRLDEANRVRSEPELRALAADLVLAGAGPTLPAVRSSQVGPTGARQSDAVSRIDPAQVPDRQFSVGFWSGRVRKGSWVPARRITAIALQGGVELDFREAVFGPGQINLHAVAVMGGIQIIVPPNLSVETSGFAILGGFEDRSEYRSGKHPSGRMLKIREFAVMGVVDIDVRLPGETARQAKGRRKKARRAKAPIVPGGD